MAGRSNNNALWKFPSHHSGTDAPANRQALGLRVSLQGGLAAAPNSGGVTDERLQKFGLSDGASHKGLVLGARQTPDDGGTSGRAWIVLTGLQQKHSDRTVGSRLRPTSVVSA